MHDDCDHCGESDEFPFRVACDNEACSVVVETIPKGTREAATILWNDRAVLTAPEKSYGYNCVVCGEPIVEPQATEQTEDGLAHAACCEPATHKGLTI